MLPRFQNQNGPECTRGRKNKNSKVEFSVFQKNLSVHPPENEGVFKGNSVRNVAFEAFIVRVCFNVGDVALTMIVLLVASHHSQPTEPGLFK